jgi:cytoskeletal protein CcmA (bactofilin family)
MTANNKIEEFLKYLSLRGVSQKSLKYYKSDIVNFLHFSKDRKIDRSLVTEYIETEKLTTPLSTLNRRLSTLRSYSSFMDHNFMEGVENVSSYKKIIKSWQDRILSKFETKPKIKNALFKLFFTRPNWYKKYHSYPLATYIHIAILILFTSVSGYAFYDQVFYSADRSLAFPTALTRPNRFLSFQGRLTSNVGNPITSATNVVFKLYDASSGGTNLWDSGTCSITPDQDGIFSTLLGSSCGAEIASSVFSENAAVWVGVTVGADAEATPRIQIATVAYALNSETLQGFPAGTGTSTIPYINSAGTLVLANASPKLQSTSGTFAVEGLAMTISTPNASDGVVTINPDGVGTLDLTFEGAAPGLSANGFVNATNANITSGSLYSGTVASAASGYNFINFLSGVSPTSKFSVDSTGLTTVGADLYVSSGISLYNNAVTDDTVEAGKFCTGDGETNCVTDFSTFATGTNYWTRSAGNISPLTLNDTISATTSASVALTLTQTGAFNALLVEDQASDTTPFVIDQSGYVGVGTSAPALPFHIWTGNAGADPVWFPASGDSVLIEDDSNAIIQLFAPTAGFLEFTDSAARAVGAIGYTHSDNHMNFNVNSAEAIRIISSGNVGIGTTTPTAKLDVAGDASASGHLVLRGAGTNYIHTLNGSNFGISTSVGGDTGLSEKLTILNSGNVGIGTTAPARNLVVYSSADIPHFQLASATSGVTNTDGFQIRTISNETYLTNFESTKMYLGNGGTQDLTIDASGNVGIGDTSPGAPLDVVGDVYISDGLSLFETAVSDGTVEATKFCTGDGETNCITDFSSIVTGSSYWTRSAGNISPLTLNDTISATTSASVALTLTQTGAFNALLVQDVAGDTTPFVIDQDGNMGIGDSAPALKLEVAGTQGYPATTGTAQTGVSRIRGTTNNNVLDIGLGSATPWGAWFQATDQSNLSLEYPLLFNPNGGNVGIGTTTPTASLDVAGDASVSGHLVMRGSGTNYIHTLNGSNFGISTSVGGDTGLSEKLTVLNSGNVGIGTTGPAELLSISGTGTNLLSITRTGTSFNVPIKLTNDTNSVYFGMNSNEDFAVGTTADLVTNGQFVVQRSTGYVGIGDMSPAAPLDVVGDAYISDGLSLYETAVSNGTVEATQFCTGDGETNCIADFSSIVTGSSYWTRSAGNISPLTLNDTISATTSAAIALTLTQTGAFNALLIEDSAGDTTPFVIDQSGNVGMGTSAPSGKLEVVKDTGTLTTETLYALRLVDGTDDTGLLLGVSATNNIGIIQTNDPFNSWTTRNLAIQPNGGNVGIGTTTPTALLDVAGTATVSGVLTVGNGTTNTLRSPYGALNFDYKSGANTWGTAMTVDDITGNVGIGKASPTTKLDVVGVTQITASGTTYATLQLVGTQAGDVGWYTLSGYPNAGDYTIRQSGVLDALTITKTTGNVGIGDSTPDRLFDVKGNVCLDLNADEACTDNTAALSDSRLKENVIDLTNSLDLIEELRAVRFNWNGEYNTGTANSLGFIAQEVETVFPELVITDTAGYKNLDYSKLTAVLAGAVQELNSKISSFSESFTSRSIKTEMISPVANADLIIDLQPDDSQTASKLVIKGENNEEVATIDAKGQITGEELIVNNDATISGTLFADVIESERLDEIEALLAEVEGNQTLFAEATNWSTDTATESATISDIIASNLFVTGNATVTSLFVAENLTAKSLDSIEGTLSIQSLAIAPVEIMAGKIKIDTNGDAIFTGNVTVAGNLELSGNFVVAEGIDPEASISATIIEGQINSNSTAGKAVLVANTTELKIVNPKVNIDSLIYVTPVSSTENKVLYVKSKDTGEFVIGFNEPITTDVEFNWWIIELKSLEANNE